MNEFEQDDLIDTPERQAKRVRHNELLHAMQTGVKFLLEHDPRAGTPKHLRVGVNSALCDHGALVRLLIDAGVFSIDQYLDAINKQAEIEVANYERELSEIFGKPVKLL